MTVSAPPFTAASADLQKCGPKGAQDDSEDEDVGECVCKIWTGSTRADDDDAVSDYSFEDEDDEALQGPSTEEAVQLTVAPGKLPSSAVQESPELPSVGSALHALGECKPCAWFWKPTGCQNGFECRHCHLCPAGEIKARKKGKVIALRQDQTQDGIEQPREECQDAFGAVDPLGHIISALGLVIPPPGLPPPPVSQLAVQEQRGVPVGANAAKPAPEAPQSLEPSFVLPSVGSALHCSGECKPCAWFWKPQGCQRGQECQHCHLCSEGECKLRKKRAADSNGQGKQPEVQQQQQRKTQQQEQQELQLEDILLPPPAAFAGLSVGSALHGTGMCKPCVWFWKPDGCENGQSCRHCHMCPDGEIKARKKTRMSVVRLQQQHMQHQEVVQQVAQLGAFQQEAADAQLFAPLPAQLGNAPLKVPAPPMPTIPEEPFEELPTLALPSVGSALHCLGTCRPCAWFWKPEGCQSGQECRHCHLCPPGEIKDRRKMKDRALRLGGLVPVKEGSDLKSYRVVKIAPLLRR